MLIKLSSPWQWVAVLAVLFAAIILSNIFAPGAVATVMSMAAAVMAALLKHEASDAPKDQ